MASDTYHEPLELLSEHTKDLHRAITSLMEELEAIDWYQQRSEATQDPELRAILAHNRDEETEHAVMVLEWLRRNSPVFDRNLRSYLMKEGSITDLEAEKPERLGSVPAESVRGVEASPPIAQASGGSLGVGSLKGVLTWTP